MILALILATIDRLPNPEESILDPRPILTPLALQYFPFPPFRDARHKFAQSSAKQQTTGPTNRIPVQNVSANFPLEHLQQAYQNNIPFYHHYDHESLEVHRASRKSRQKSPRVMYLTSATLVIVPATLHHQWSNEINKHCDHTLKYLVVEENGSLPPAQVLAGRFDLILMSHTRFSREARKNDLEKLYKQPPCRCSVPPGQTVRIRWKRLVIDEGHVASAKSIETNLMTLVKHISVQYKWIVTGTPTTNLMGLRFGENSNSADATNAIQKALQLKLLSQEGSLSSEKYDGDGDAGDTIEELELQYPDESTEPSEKRQRWTKQDRHDLKKLGNMLVYFLEGPRFASEPSLFTSHVIDPLMYRTGALPGSVRVLRQVMESVMIRHRVEDIENEVTLPPLQQETILLDMDPYAVMTYNVMQSSVVINAVDSERVGSDYLLHSDNVKELRQTIENISQAMFWHVDDMLFSVEERVARFQEYSERAAQKLAEGKISKQDFDMLQKR
ncbi:SNF2 family N-terminal domain-containing protein [Irpex lacteus]|nr:SNF2 family N-terminal domain-containing protein [Irpex lacteus]